MTTAADILTQYEPLAWKLAHRFKGSGVPMDDLLQAARMGIVIGWERYDESQGSLTSCLYLHARSEIIGLCREMSRAVSTKSRQADKLLADVRRMTKIVEAEGLAGAEARQEVTERLGRPIEKVETAVMIMTPSGPPMESECGVLDDEQDLDTEVRRRVLVEAMSKLKPREAEAVRRMFVEGQSGPKAGIEMGCTGERVRQLSRAGPEKLKKDLAQRGFDFSDLV